MKVLGVYNIKGGVGKTTTSVNLAQVAARRGAQVLLWDLDPQGAASFYFRVRPRLKGGSKALVRGVRPMTRLVRGTDDPRIDLLPADFSHRHMDLFLDEASKPHRRLRKRLRPVEGEYDYVIADCPPSISLVSENVFQFSDALLVPLIPTTLSARTLEQLIEFLAGSRWAGLSLLPFYSMADRRKRLHREIMETLRHPGLLRTIIPSMSEVEQMGRHRAPVGSFAPQSEAAQLYEQMWSEIEAFLWGRKAQRAESN
jgi:cellulose biosynthesis protein BcsQ